MYCITPLIVNNSKSLKANYFAHNLFTVNSWVVCNFVGCGLDAKSELFTSQFFFFFFKIAFNFWSNHDAMYKFPKCTQFNDEYHHNSLFPMSNIHEEWKPLTIHYLWSESRCNHRIRDMAATGGMISIEGLTNCP